MAVSVIVSILNQKGGSGKTTLATNIAMGLFREGGRVLLVDTDPQGSARDWRAAWEDNPVPVIGLDRPTLARDISAVGEDYDIVIVDGAPQLQEMAAAAIKASDAILIPVQPSPYDIWATSDLVDLIGARQEISEGRLQASFVVSRAIRNTRLSKEVFDALSHYSMGTFSSFTSQRVSYAMSASEGRSVFDMEDFNAQLEIHSIIGELMQWVN